MSIQVSKKKTLLGSGMRSAMRKVASRSAHFFAFFALSGLILLSAPAAAVTIDQSPLIVQKTLAPNLVLMLDDSGSMASDYMPDGMWNAADMDFRASSENGTYYNPNVLYAAPPKATSTTASPVTYDGAGATPGTSADCTGTSATSFAFPCGWYNGFDHSDTGSRYSSNGLKDITNWSSDVGNGQPYFVALNPSPTLTCPSGYTAVSGQCVITQSATVTAATPDCGWRGHYDSTTQQCYVNTRNGRYYYNPTSYSCSSGDQLINGDQCASCPTGYSYSADLGMCAVYASPTSTSCPAGSTAQTDSSGATYCYTGKNAFAYSTGNAGALAQNLVAVDCFGASRCHNASDALTIDGVTTTYGQNVANWFTYYRTRILMAKSGLMSAFSNLDSDYRVGFGSIDGSNVAGLGSNVYSFTTYTNRSSYSTGLAKVNRFQNGASGTQKSNFWDWLVGTSPAGSTPLRGALNAVGQYYETAQPWLTDPTESDSKASSTNAYSCRQAYTILTTDGYWNGSTPANIGDQDSTAGPTNTGPNQQTYTFKANPPYADNNSNTLADVAMKYWKNDLCPTGSSTCDLANEVPTTDADPGFWQHMVTFTVGLGVTPKDGSGSYIDPSIQQQLFSWAIDDKGTSSTYAISGFTWGTDQIADLMHAGLDGHGGFYSAKNPQEFAKGISDALASTKDRVGTGASLAANSTKLATGTMTYQASYYTGKWTGDLRAFTVDPNTGGIVTPAAWSSSDALAAQIKAATDSVISTRTIKTYNPDTGTFVSFTSPSNLSSAEQAALGSDSGTQQGMINYLRGNDSLEQKNGGTYRTRDSYLGDIVNSQPVYVGAPDPNVFSGKTFAGSGTYASFAATNVSRTPLIYVAANDGMLHAFYAQDVMDTNGNVVHAAGSEAFAYLPAAVITNAAHPIKDISDPNYRDHHQFFNDGELTVADVYVGGNDKTWHTILVGTTGKGPAQAVYALDITDPNNIVPLWERSASDGKVNSSYIGQMVGKPLIAQTSDKQWSVLLGNGYNSASGHTALMEFALTNTNGSALDTSGTLTVIDAGVGQGLSPPTTWMSDAGNNVSTYAYAGDLDGHVWKFNLATGAVTKLFTATDSSGTVQPITAGMLAGQDPTTGNVWLFFGTGQYLNQNDLSDTSVQTWYGIIVQKGALETSSADLVGNLAGGRNYLVQRSIIAEQAASPGNPNATPPVLPTLAARAFTLKPSPSDMTGKSGWYMDLVSPVKGKQGERMVTPNQFQGNLLIGTSRIPEAADVCNPSGTGWIMALDPFTGTNPTENFFDLNGDGVFDSSDMVDVNGVKVPAGAVGFTSMPNNPIFVGNVMLTSFDNGSTSSIKTAGTTGTMRRVGWQELINQ